MNAALPDEAATQVAAYREDEVKNGLDFGEDPSRWPYAPGRDR